MYTAAYNVKRELSAFVFIKTRAAAAGIRARTANGTIGDAAVRFAAASVRSEDG